VNVRAAVDADYDAYARLFPELGVDDPLPSRERFIADLLARMLVAVEGDEVVGYSLLEILSDTGYVRNIVTALRARRRGVGAALMAAMRARFVAAGATMWCLNVKPDNAAAIALYRGCGLAPAYHSAALRVPAQVPLASPPDIELVPLPAEADSVIEPRFRLLRGQLASARARPSKSRHVVQLRRGNETLGVGVFSAAIPGAFPFRLVEPALAGAFIAHLRTLAPPDAAFVQVGIEDDDALRAALLALGAYVQLEILHMRGMLA
jgi:GNAT superfamily N-acetyltransferase